MPLRRWHTDRIAVAVVCVVAVACMALTAIGCGQSGAIQSYNKYANELIAELNKAKIDLRTHWEKPLSEQGDIGATLANMRKALASCQEKLDSTDCPMPSRPLKELMSKSVNTGRILADLAAPYADYLAVMAPLAKQASDIVVQLQALDKSQYVPSTVANLAEKARKLEASLLTVPPNAAFQAVTDQFKEYVAEMVKNLTKAQEVLGQVPSFVPEEPQQPAEEDEDEGAETTSPEEAVNRENMRQIQKIEPYTEPIIEDWGRLEGQVNAELEEVRAAMGLQAKVTEVENYIGQAVQQIQALEKQYK